MSRARYAPLLLLALAVGLLLPAGCGEPPSGDGLPPATGRVQPYDVDGLPVVAGWKPSARPNVVLIVIDTLRADALAPDADGTPTMPKLAALSRQGTRFTNAVAPCSWTLPSIASLLTGKLPHAHGVIGEERAFTGLHPLASWAEIMSNGLGYETIACVAGPWPGGANTLLQGFQNVVGNFSLQGAPAFLSRWSARRDTRRPFFLTLHSFEAHEPYGKENHPFPARPLLAETESPSPLEGVNLEDPAEVTRRYVLDGAFREAVLRRGEHTALHESMTRYIWSGFRADPKPHLAEELRYGYREGARWVDGLIGETVDALRAQKLLENTLLIVTSDHGEAFGEHGMLLHGRTLYDELVRVPLVVIGPESTGFTGGRVVEGSVGITDLMPTVLALTGAPVPDDLDGVSLLPLMRGETAGRPIISEESRTPLRTGGASDAMVQSVRNEDWKVILTYERVAGTVIEEAYDLRTDPEEQKNLAKDGRVTDLSFDLPFCRALERVRDRVWAAVSGSNFMLDSGYMAGPAYVKGERPKQACEVSEKR
jgi:arylsulfatase A-like enzyme